MKNSDKSLGVLENFALWYTHKTREEAENEGGLKDLHQLTAIDLYKHIDNYIKEDHVDGKGNLEDHIVTFGAESSFDHEDVEKEYPENVVVVADFGESGTQTIATIQDADNLQAVKDLLEFIKDPYGKRE